MVLLSSFNLFIGLASAVAGVACTSTSPLLSRRILHERRGAVPQGWSLHRRADPDTVIPLSIALRQSNLGNLDDYLLEIADPTSPKYGQHWTPARVAQTFRPSKESVDAVRTWLVHDGVDGSRIQFTKDRAYLQLNVTVAEAESLLATEYYVYQHDDSGVEHLACHHGYRLPEHVSSHVDLVSPTIQFGGIKLGAALAKRGGASPAKKNMPRPHGPPKTPVAAEVGSALTADATNCDQQVTPDCLRELYGFNYTFVATDKNKVGVVELADQTYVAKDLDVFFKKFAPELVGVQPTLVSIDGGNVDFTETDESIIGESNLDFQLIMPLLGKEQQVSLFQVGGSGSFNLLLDAVDGAYCTFDGGDDPSEDVVPSGVKEDCGTKAPAFVYSVSYAGAEDDDVHYMQRQCTEFGKLALAGMTFLFASGDNGVASNSANLCLLPNGTAADAPGAFLPNFPATCPYVTAVGSTQVDAGKSARDVESATSSFGSGGGFSNVFPRPKWQKRAVGGYLSKVGGSLGYAGDVFNRSGRGVPDVAANGFPTAVVIDGNFTLSGGTSASTPIFAAMVAAVNDARLAAGKGPVGWMNPALYSHMFAGVFNDITNGTNPGCGTDGFPTATGWDPVTGLGTVKFQQLLQRFLTLP
ncbi:subtilisin-like protein [Dichomitus squalens]|uniref:tripeptidyl-peptidase II n=1 Tax=Dichomitus squalens TaxID=114155 RepID=A0A4Q9MYS9_9APHY|nr:subtilisin-like protein [Dichomitus squalens]